MNFKLFNTSLGTAYNFTSFVRSNSSTLRHACLVPKQMQFSSQSNSDDSNPESPLKKRLESALPLKPVPDSTWATSPFVKGTVFGHSENAKELNLPHQVSVIMFPGQGNQFVGMANRLKNFPVAMDMFHAASEILGYDLLKLCTEGPREKLDMTEYCQPATLVSSLAALEILKEEKPWAINNCVGTCGYSLGEFSALVFSGCINFEKAVKLVKFRAEAMSLCCNAVEGGMMTVLYRSDCPLGEALANAVNHCIEKGIESPHCAVASYLFCGCRVIAGNVEALNYLMENSKKYRIRKMAKLQVSGAFHTKLMQDAADTFAEFLKKVEFKEPVIHVYSSVSGNSLKNLSELKKLLKKQMCAPVKWEQVMNTIIRRPEGMNFPFMYECGPGNSLCTILQKIHGSVQCYAVRL